MTGNEFLRGINRLGCPRGIGVHFDQRHGKGSHGTLHYGSRKTTLKEICARRSAPVWLHAILGQLGLSRRDLDE